MYFQDSEKIKTLDFRYFTMSSTTQETYNLAIKDKVHKIQRNCLSLKQ